MIMAANAKLQSLLCAALLLLLLNSVSAAPPAGPPSPTTWPALSNIASDGKLRFDSKHQGLFGGRRIQYHSSVAEVLLKAPDGTPAARAITIAYTAAGVKEGASRPVIFIYNGGPGCASSFLHFGAFGPKRMVSISDEALADPSTAIVDNAHTLLDTADLVFLDPPDTGFSRRLEQTPPRLFMSIDGDSFVVGQMILHWLSANGRLDSPVYLAGESYGTLRNVALARDLAKATPRIQLQGIVMISQAITYNGPASINPRRSDLMRPIIRMPDIAAMAWYHGKIDNQSQTVEEAIAKAKVFARTEYASALLQGNKLSKEERARVAARLAELTGISAQYYLEHNLRISDYRRELLRNEGKALAQFDGRVTEPLAGLVEDRDRDWAAAFRGINQVMERYAERDLKAKGLGNYLSCVHDPYGYEEGWTYVVAPRPTLDVVLTEVMKEQPTLRLLIPQGIFDTTSSMGSTISMFEQLDIPSERVAVTYYAGGHMVYSDPESLEKFMNDLRVFVSGRAPSEAIPRVSPSTRGPTPASLE
jgi:carboxypeptidase C (cathepsin A)